GKVHEEKAAKTRETQNSMNETYRMMAMQPPGGGGYYGGLSGGMSSYSSTGTSTSMGVGTSMASGPVTMATSYYSGSDSPLVQICMQRGIDIRTVTLNDGPMLGMDQNTLYAEMMKLGINPYQNMGMQQGLNNYGGFMMRR
ncbi:MAG: hypothetical protein AB1758_24770, partial [Candidatus Eremiobacterota bacterium]